jgi:hypothetical protein
MQRFHMMAERLTKPDHRLALPIGASVPAMRETTWPLRETKRNA